MQTYLTDTERDHRPPAVRGQYRFWMDFRLNLKTRTLEYRRWFPDVDSRNAYIVGLPANCNVTNHGEEPE